MADEYDPTDCELGICGPCERCQEQDGLREELGENATLKDYDNHMKTPDTQKTPIGTKCKGGWIGEGDVGITCTKRATKPDGYCDGCRDPLAGDADKYRPVGTIDLTPSWLAIVGLYLEMLERPEFSAAKRQEMKDEILRAAKLADLYAKEHKR